MADRSRKYKNTEDLYKKVNGDKTSAAYVSLSEKEGLSQYTEAVVKASEYTVAQQDRGGGGGAYRPFDDLTPYTSSYPGLTDQQFAVYRPLFERPTKHKDIIAFAREVYYSIGLIHNAIDLMGDFACQGIRIVHPNPTIQKFYRGWFKAVGGKEVSERIAHLLFREANAVIRFYTQKINRKKRQQWQRTVGAEDVFKPKRNELPWNYTFIDPRYVKIIGDTAGLLSDVQLYEIELPQKLVQDLRALVKRADEDEEARKVLESIPKDILDIIQDRTRRKKTVTLPSDKTIILTYKKDSWQQWAYPIVYAAFDDLMLYKKLKLADRAATDGATQKIRVWKLGSLEHNLAPTAVASEALSEMLSAHTGGGTKDFIWGPDIDLIETDTDVSSFLGEEKYRPTLMAIYAALGIPPTLTGTFGASGTTNNFISLKTLVERLNYVRDILVHFWSEQLYYVQQAMGFSKPATIEFDMMYLDDPASMLSLLKDLADRNIVSDEFVQRYIKANPEIEEERLKKEKKRRAKRGDDKVSPYHVVDKDFNLKRIALQAGVATPSEVGLVLLQRKDGELTRLDILNKRQSEPKPQQAPNDGGRPPGTKDTVPRKKRDFQPVQKAHVKLWADKMQEKIAKEVTPIILEVYGKKSVRELTAEQFDALEKLKFEILCSLRMDEDVSVGMQRVKSNTIQTLHDDFDRWLPQDQQLTVAQIRDLRSIYYSEVIHGNLQT